MMVEIPERLPISGKKGSGNLIRLRRRSEHLQQRIESADHDLSYDKAEFMALEWAIKHIIMYEDLLKKESPEASP